nr:MAG: ABC-type antimicrobial peptide transport system, ATPase component [Candidatus Nanosalinarum sp. J07AB56]
MNAIETRDLKKVYEMGELEVNALEGVDLEIEEGEFAAMMGPSGSGKSTLMHLLGLLDTPSSGEIMIDGVETSNYSEHQRDQFRLRKIGFVFQFYSMLSGLEAYNDARLPLLLSGASERASLKKAKEALQRVGLGERIEHDSSEMSGGQRQRAAIARAIVNDPEIVFADEPTSELGTETSEAVVDLFREISEEGRTVVMVNHEEEMARRADRVIYLEDGKVVDSDY